MADRKLVPLHPRTVRKPRVPGSFDDFAAMRGLEPIHSPASLTLVLMGGGVDSLLPLFTCENS